MEKADELGSLLKVEAEIEETIKKVYKGWGGMFESFDDDKWNKVRTEIDNILSEFSEEAKQRGEVRQSLIRR